MVLLNCSFKAFPFRVTGARVFSLLLALSAPLVQAAPNLNVNLAWAGPSANADGSTLSGPLRYKMYMGQTSHNYNIVQDVGTAKTVHVIGLVTNKSYYISVVASDNKGKLSSFSSELRISTFDTDKDGLLDWVESGTGRYVSPQDTGSLYNDPDTDNDGKLDGAEVAAGTNPDVGTGTTTPVVTTTTTNRMGVAYDYDGDGIADYAVYKTGGTWYVRQSKNGGVLDGAAFNWGGSTWPVTGDFDGDKKADVASYNPSSGQWSIRNSSNRTTQTIQLGGSGYEPEPADYDGDGRSDAATFRLNNASWTIRKRDGSVSSTTWGTAYTAPVPADYDGDKKADLAVFDPVTGVWTIRQSSNLATRKENLYLASAQPVPADYDGDGKADVAAQQPSSTYWYIQLSASGKSILKVPWGTSAMVPAPADYDGDKKADVATFLQSSGTWYVRPSKAPTTTKKQWWSWQTAQALPAVIEGY